MSGQSAAVFEARGHRVYVANARKLRAISASHTKSDEEDAQMLARLGRADPKLLSPVRHRSEVTQRALVRLKVREALVRSRVNLINSARFLRKTLEDPKHFAHARSVGPYLGLVPRRDQSGESDKQLPITKAGHAQLRCLLVNCAHYSTSTRRAISSALRGTSGHSSSWASPRIKELSPFEKSPRFTAVCDHRML